MRDLTKCTTTEALMDVWEKDAEGKINIFIRDGIVCDAEYEEPHILFVMRDMNTGTKCDLREELRTTGSGWKTWNNAARWISALLTGNECYPYEIDRRNEMRKIAVLNLKKEAGGPRANKENLRTAAEQHKEFIVREIELCDPEIIICGGFGNAGILKDCVFKEKAGEWQKIQAEKFNSVWWYYYASINGKPVPVISFCHPQVTNFNGKRGHKDLFEPLFREMLMFRKMFLMHQKSPNS